MGNDKKKKIILISSIGVVVLIVILLLILFLATDIFKSPQQLFYKYLPQNMQLFDMMSSNLATSHDQKMKKTAYTSNGEIAVTYEMGSGESQESDNSSEIFKVITEGKVDNQNQKQYNKVTLTKNNKELLAVKYLRNGDLYALGSDEIVTKYVAVENNNLKDFATQLGYQEVSQIPNKLEENYNLDALIQLTEEEKEYISKNYGSLIVKNINKNQFTKTKNVNLTVDGQTYQAQKYILTLTSQEIKDLTIKILQQLQKDEQTLNILLSKYNMLAQNQEVTIEVLKQKIQELEQSISTEQIANVQIKISLYVSDNKLIKTDIAVGENLISVQYSNSTRESKIMIKNESSAIQGFNTVELKKSENDEQYVLSVIISNSNDTQNTITFQTSKVGNVNSNTIRNLTILTVNAQNSIYTIKYSANINFENNIEIEELNQDNSITLNTYSSEELQNLITAIMDRTKQVWSEKMQLLGSEGEVSTSLENSNNITPEGSGQEGEEQQTELSSTEKLAIEMFNKQFLAYLGDSVQADKVRELLKVTKTAIQNQNPVKVKFSGTYNNTAVEKEASNVEELENLEVYIVNGKNYFVQGIAESTGKLTELVIKENTNNT